MEQIIQDNQWFLTPWLGVMVVLGAAWLATDLLARIFRAMARFQRARGR